MLYSWMTLPQLVLMSCRYGFVKFMTKDGANKAMQELHQTEMEAFPNMKVSTEGTVKHICAVQLALWYQL